MSDATAGLLQAGVLLAALGSSYRPMGRYLAHVLTSDRHWKGERLLYTAMGVGSDADQRWPTYARSLLAFSAVSVAGLYGLQRLQEDLPVSPNLPTVAADQAFNTAVSFVTASR